MTFLSARSVLLTFIGLFLKNCMGDAQLQYNLKYKGLG